MVPFGTSVKTRLLYVALFLLSIISCWVFVNWGPTLLAKVPAAVFNPDFCVQNHCFGALSVYRITFGLALFHVGQSLLMIGVRTTGDCRAMVQNGFWIFKLAALIGLIVAAFFIPMGFFVYYGWFALVCAVIFLFIQLVLLVDFAHSWSESWLAKYNEEPENIIWFRALMGSTVLMYIVSFSAVIAMYVLFGSTAECSTNAVFISIALLSGIALSCLAVHPRVQERSPQSGLLQPAVVFMYMVYLVWSAIMSEPAGSDLFPNCNQFSSTADPLESGTQKVGTLMGAVLVIIAVSYSAVRTSAQHDTLLGSSVEEATPLAGGQSIDEVAAAAEGTSINSSPSTSTAPAAAPEPVGYNYAFFHVVFALASMYICMLMTNWAVVHNEIDVMTQGNMISIDQSVASVWIKVASSWFVAVLFAWSLVAPVVFADRTFGS